MALIGVAGGRSRDATSVFALFGVELGVLRRSAIVGDDGACLHDGARGGSSSPAARKTFFDSWSLFWIPLDFQILPPSRKS